MGKIAITLHAVRADSYCGELSSTLSHLKTLGSALGGCVGSIYSVHGTPQLMSGPVQLIRGGGDLPRCNIGRKHSHDEARSLGDDRGGAGRDTDGRGGRGESLEFLGRHVAASGLAGLLINGTFKHKQGLGEFVELISTDDYLPGSDISRDQPHDVACNLNDCVLNTSLGTIGGVASGNQLVRKQDEVSSCWRVKLPQLGDASGDRGERWGVVNRSVGSHP